MKYKTKYLLLKREINLRGGGKCADKCRSKKIIVPENLYNMRDAILRQKKLLTSPTEFKQNIVIELMHSNDAYTHYNTAYNTRATSRTKLYNILKNMYEISRKIDTTESPQYFVEYGNKALQQLESNIDKLFTLEEKLKYKKDIQTCISEINELEQKFLEAAKQKYAVDLNTYSEMAIQYITYLHNQMNGYYYRVDKKTGTNKINIPEKLITKIEKKNTCNIQPLLDAITNALTEIDTIDKSPDGTTHHQDLGNVLTEIKNAQTMIIKIDTQMKLYLLFIEINDKYSNLVNLPYMYFISITEGRSCMESIDGIIRYLRDISTDSQKRKYLLEKMYIIQPLEITLKQMEIYECCYKITLAIINIYEMVSRETQQQILGILDISEIEKCYDKLIKYTPDSIRTQINKIKEITQKIDKPSDKLFQDKLEEEYDNIQKNIKLMKKLQKIEIIPTEKLQEIEKELQKIEKELQKIEIIPIEDH